MIRETSELGGLFDPLAFAADALALRGALVENGLVLAPEDLARELHVPAEFRLGVGDGAVACGLGAPLLDALVSAARTQKLAAAVTLDLPSPKASHATSLASRFVVRNAVADVGSALAGEAWYAAAHVAFVAEADDRHEGLVYVVANACDGAVPDPALGGLVDSLSQRELFGVERGGAREVAGAAGHGLAQVVRLASKAVAVRVAEIARSVERRHRRDHARIVEYFGSMIAETRTPRRRQDPAATASKVTHLVAERDAKLRELDTRYVLRTTLSPAALLLVRVPAVTVTLRIRRRKAERELSLRLPAGAPALDALACEACGLPTSRPAVCDERVHVLCETCAPSAQGRPDCAVCNGPRARVR
jgi:hypothetical protein